MPLTLQTQPSLKTQLKTKPRIKRQPIRLRRTQQLTPRYHRTKPQIKRTLQSPKTPQMLPPILRLQLIILKTVRFQQTQRLTVRTLQVRPIQLLMQQLRKILPIQLMPLRLIILLIPQILVAYNLIRLRIRRVILLPIRVVQAIVRTTLIKMLI
jgi:hypothetical protein